MTQFRTNAPAQPHPRKSSLAASQVRLITLMQQINFGRLEGFSVRHGKPVLTRPPRIVREIKLGGENGPRPEIGKTDFELKAQVRDLFAQMEALGDGVVRSLEIKHGLPFKMTVEEVPA